MVKITYNNNDQLVAIIQNHIEKYNAENVTVVCDGYYSARSIVNELIRYGYDLAFAELEEPDWDNYEKEFYLQIYEGEISLEKAFKHGKYFHLEEELVFFMEECDPVIKDIAKNCTTIVLVAEQENPCNGDCENCEHYLENPPGDEGIHVVGEFSHEEEPVNPGSDEDLNMDDVVNIFKHIR